MLYFGDGVLILYCHTAAAAAAAAACHSLQSYPFHVAVPPKQAPDYNKIVKEPMHLQLMKDVRTGGWGGGGGDGTVCRNFAFPSET